MTKTGQLAGVWLRLAEFSESYPGLLIPGLKAVEAYADHDFGALTGAALERAQHEALLACAKTHGMPPNLVVELLDALDDVVEVLG